MEDPAESASERDARMRLERILGTRLRRIVPDDRPSPDYSFTTPGGSLAAVEVKQVASPDWLHLKNGHSRHETDRETNELQMHWMVMLDAEIAAERLDRVPNFPDDDEEQIARAAEFGFETTRRAERVAAHERRRDEHPHPFQIRGMIDDLIPDLAALEARGIRTTRGELPIDTEGSQAWWRIARRTRGAICMASEAKPDDGLPAGVFLLTGYGYVRTGRPDTIVDRIDAWMSSKRSDNLVASLHRPEYAKGHAVLVFDGLEPEWWSAQEADAYVLSRCPTLPEQVDVLWALLGRQTLRYSKDSGWSGYLLDTQVPTNQ